MERCSAHIKKQRANTSVLSFDYFNFKHNYATEICGGKNPLNNPERKEVLFLISHFEFLL